MAAAAEAAKRMTRKSRERPVWSVPARRNLGSLTPGAGLTTRTPSSRAGSDNDAGLALKLAPDGAELVEPRLSRQPLGGTDSAFRESKARFGIVA
jgi:hypothetical protein